MSLRKLVVALGTTLCSLHASAGYIQYDIVSNSMSGYFIQHDQDHSIAYFNFTLTGTNTGDRDVNTHSYADIGWAKRYANSGPTCFGIAEDDTEGIEQRLHFSFTATDNPYEFTFKSKYTFDQVWSPVEDYVLPSERLSYYGKVVRGGPVDDLLAFQLDEYLEATDGERYTDMVHRRVPTLLPDGSDIAEFNDVPEPGTFALMALGAVGLMKGSRKITLRS